MSLKIRDYPQFGESSYVYHPRNQKYQTLSSFQIHLRNLSQKICQLVDKIIESIFYAYRLHFTPAANNLSAPKLGEFVLTDLRVSSHTTESFEWKKHLIASAEKSIEISGNFVGGEAFREVLDLIEDRMQAFPELKAHILVSKDLLENEDIAELKRLKNNYANQFEYLISDRVLTIDPRPLTEENHTKLLVVDEKYFVMGGSGIQEKMVREIVPQGYKNKGPFASKLLSNAFVDSDLIGRGEIAKTMRNQFFNLYRILEYRMQGTTNMRYFPVTGKLGICKEFDKEENLYPNVKMKYIVGGPENRRLNPINQEYIRLVDNSKRKVRIASLCFDPHTDFQKSLQRAKGRDIKVHGYLNSIKSLKAIFYTVQSRANYHLLSKAYDYKGEDQLYHKKIMTIDDQISVIGSYNLGIKSFHCDYETIAVIDDIRITKVFNDSLKSDAKKSSKLNQADLKEIASKWKIIGILTRIFVGPFFS